VDAPPIVQPDERAEVAKTAREWGATSDIGPDKRRPDARPLIAGVAHHDPDGGVSVAVAAGTSLPARY